MEDTISALERGREGDESIAKDSIQTSYDPPVASFCQLLDQARHSQVDKAN